VLPTKAKTCSW